MSESNEPVIQTCTACGALIDVSDEEPFALMHCPACGTAQRVRRNFDHFELQEIMGAGGMGAVYRAMDTSLNRSVALKLLRKEYSADQEFVEQFEKEAAITASINHPNVVKVYTAGQDHGLVYIAMELVDKGSLDDLMNLQGRVAESQVLEVGIQIARGLNAALQRGLIHRDVKPGNILFADAHTAKIVDFGLAVLQEHASTVAGDVWGTPYYVAPEKLENSPEDFRSDMYSLGGTLFHAVAGRPPFEAETASMVALKHLKSQVVSLQAFAPDVSSATAYVINKTLAKEPDDRYQSYDELIQHLEYARDELLKAAARGPTIKTRVVLEDADTAKAVGWVTFAMIAVIVIGGVALYVKRDAIFGKDDKPDPVAVEQRQRATEFEGKFKEGRDLLVAGKFPEAAASFEALAANPNLPQPLLNWVSLHHGMALLFAGREADARSKFAELANRGRFSADPTEQKMADFFVNVAGKLAGQAVIPFSVSGELNKGTYEALPLLLYAVKDWQMGEFDQAGPLFRQFWSASPGAPFEWMTEYKELAGRYIDAYSVYAEGAGKLRRAETLKDMKAAVDSAREDLEKIKGQDALKKMFEKLITEVEQKVAEAEAADSVKRAAADEADAKALSSMRSQIMPLLQQIKFAEAKAATKALSPAGKKARAEQAKLLKISEWLIRFKAALIADLNATGYSKAVMRRNGQMIPGTASRANELGVEVRTPFGGQGATWAELAPDTILKMARSFILPSLAPEAAADRQWLAGVFAITSGRQNEGMELLNAAAQANPKYQEELPILTQSGEG